MAYQNHKPEIHGTDDGIWRRIKLIPFTAQFHDPEDAEAYSEGLFKDKLLMSKLKTELQGILAWAVRGAIAWYKDGLREPDIIKNSTREYREEMDVIGGFIKDCLVKSELGKVKG